TTITGAPEPPNPTGCPTIIATTNQCRTCAYPMCLVISTLTHHCNCPDAPETSLTSHPCHSQCGGIGCSTSWIISTATNCGVTTTTSSSPSTGTSTTDTTDTTATSQPSSLTATVTLSTG
ncbi:hypothetical protein B0T17DRAFT_457513, partial [Bombardia bombarda]